MKLPNPTRRFTRLDFGPNPRIPTKTPAEIGKVYPHMVPAVDDDANEIAGIAMPIITVPLATHAGWNLRHQDIGGGGQVLSTGGASGGTLRGSTIPFAVTRRERESTGDKRLSIEERYASKEQYLQLVKKAAEDLIGRRYLLEEDLEPVIEQASQLYDYMTGQAAETQAAAD